MTDKYGKTITTGTTLAHERVLFATTTVIGFRADSLGRQVAVLDPADFERRTHSGPWFTEGELRDTGWKVLQP